MLRLLMSATIACAYVFAGAPYTHAYAQDYPTRPIKVLVGFPPGGSVDIAARVIGAKMAAQLGQNVVIENRPGAVGTAALAGLKEAQADGYTLLSGAGQQLRAGMTAADDPYKDFEAVALTNVIPIVLLINPTVGIGSLSELIERAKEAPGKLSYATPGTGSPMHVAMEALKAAAGINIVHVPYRGGPPAVADTVAGHVQMIAVGLPTALGQVETGQLRPLAVLQGQPSENLPGVPTASQAAGIQGVDFLVWNGFFAPKGTPKPILEKLEHEIQIALAAPEVHEKLRRSAMDVTFAPASELAKIAREQHKRMIEAVDRFAIQIN